MKKIKIINFCIIIFSLLFVNINCTVNNKQKSNNENNKEMKILVSYFSATGTTKAVAEIISKEMKADIYEIYPDIPYTAEDLDWQNEESRSSVEMKDKTFRPIIADKNANIEDYDVIFVGFPIWWYVAPTIINTFLESYDFSGKTVILFATSGGSDFGDTLKELEESCSSTTVIKEGKVFKGSASEDDVLDWVKNLTL